MRGKKEPLPLRPPSPFFRPLGFFFVLEKRKWLVSLVRARDLQKQTKSKDEDGPPAALWLPCGAEKRVPRKWRAFWLAFLVAAATDFCFPVFFSPCATLTMLAFLLQEKALNDRETEHSLV